MAVLAVTAILVAANLGERAPAWRTLAYGLLAGLAAIVAMLGLLALLALAEAALSTNLAGQLGISPAPRAYAGAGLQLAGAVLAPLVLLPVFRRALARRLGGFNADSAVHAVSAALYILVFTTLISAQVAVDQLKAIAQRGDSPSLLLIVGTNQLPMLLVSLAGVGFLVRRSWRQTLDRLGLVLPKWRWLAVSVGVAVALLVLGFIFDELMARLTPEQSKSIQQVSNQLLRNVSGIPAIVILGLAAGIGEEVLFRGALLPRFGNIPSAVLFATLHTQYAISLATVEILVLGLVLGVLRRRAGTTGCIVAHSGYDILVGLISLAH
jgi:membrane protease YdiL (CAAX protease family)